MSGSAPPDHPPEWRDESRDATKDTAAALIGFTASFVRGGALLVAPVIRMLEDRPPTKPLADEVAEEIVFEPLRVLVPRAGRTVRRLVGRFTLVVLLTVGVLLLPAPEGLSPEAHRGIAGFVFTASMLALEPVSLPIAALLVPVALVALGTADIGEALGPFASPTVFLVLSSLFLAEALRKHGITRRLAYVTVVLSGGGIGRLLLGMMAVAAFFSMWVENTATAAILIPVAMTISRQVPDPERAKPFLVLLVMGIAYSASIGGMVTIMGSAANAVASDFLSQVLPWTFLDWMKFGLPSLAVVFPITWLLLLRLIPVAIDRLEVAPAQTELDKLGPMSGTEKLIVRAMAVAIFFWVTGSFIEQSVGLPPTLLSSAVVAILTVGYLSARSVIDWEDVKGVSWGIFFIIGAGLSLGETLVRTGATEWFAQLIEPLVTELPLLASMIVLVYLSAFLTNLLNNTTIAAVFVPILISIAGNVPSLSVTQLVMPVTLATTFGYSLPSASGRMALIASTGIVERRDMMRFGLVATTVSAGVLGLLFFVFSQLGLV